MIVPGLQKYLTYLPQAINHGIKKHYVTYFSGPGYQPEQAASVSVASSCSRSRSCLKVGS